MLQSLPRPTCRRVRTVIALAVLASLSYAPRGAFAHSSGSTISALPRSHSKGLQRDDGHFGGWKAPSTSSGNHVGSRVGDPNPGGYSPRRIRGFWNHYHGAPSPRKSKPSEGTK